MLIQDAQLQLILDLVGVFVFALSGGLVAVKKRLDLFGVLVLAGAAALGGGVFRDVLIGAVPPVGLSDWRLVAAACVGRRGDVHLPPRRRAHLAAGAGAGRRRARRVRRRRCPQGARVGAGPVAAVLVGGITAVGGGILRDVLAGQVPEVLRRELYAVPALLGALIVVVAQRARPPHHHRGVGRRPHRLRRAHDGRRARPQRPQTPANRRPPVSTPQPESEANPLAPYDADPAAVLRRPGAARRGDAVPAQRHGRARHPGRAAGRGGRALLRVRRAQPHQRPEPRAARRAARRARPPRHRDPRCSGATATSTRSSPTPCARRTRRGVRRVLTVVTSAYSCYSSCRQYREDLAEAVGALADEGRDLAGGQGAALLEPPRLRPGQQPPGDRGRPPAGAGAGRPAPAGLRHALDPGRDGRHVRSRRRRGQPLPPPAPAARGARSPTRSTPR